MIYPTNNHILVHEVAKEETTSGGIILGGVDIDTGSKPGYVVAVGPDCDQKLLNQTVYLQWGKGMAVTNEGKMGVLISDEHIMGISG